MIDDSNLIFLISQPRSGSSLMQQLLLNHSSIKSEPEPWQMLSVLYSFKDNNLMEGYNPHFSNINFRRYLKEDGLKYLKGKLKDLSLDLYNFNIKNSRYFLDKTPRYYHIIDELYEIFPNAKYIFLVRNPVSVFNSILNYNFDGNIYDFLASGDRIDDLLLAPLKLCQAKEKYSNNIFLSYEKVIETPEYYLKSVYSYLDIIPPENMLNYKVDEDFIKSNAVDKKSLQKHQTLTNDYSKGWEQKIDSDLKKKLILGYLEVLEKYVGREYLGYDLEKLYKKVEQYKPKKRTYFNPEFSLLTTNEKYLSFLALNRKRVFQKIYYTFYHDRRNKS